MSAYAPKDVRIALLRWIERGLRFERDLSRWPLEARGLRRVVSREWRKYVVGNFGTARILCPMRSVTRSRYPEAAATAMPRAGYGLSIWAEDTDRDASDRTRERPGLRRKAR